MDSKTNILKEINAALAVVEATIAANGALIAANGALITSNSNAIISNAGAIAANAAAIAAAGYVDRGDLASYDFVKNDLTFNGQWNELDLSGIIPEGCILILLRVNVYETVGYLPIQFRQKGITNVFNNVVFYSHKTGGFYEDTICLTPDNDRKIEYAVLGATWVQVNLVILGYLV